MHGDETVDLPAWADPSVPESELDSGGISRRNLLRGAGLLGGGIAAVGVTPWNVRYSRPCCAAH
jgi:hypothetical protein